MSHHRNNDFRTINVISRTLPGVVISSMYQTKYFWSAFLSEINVENTEDATFRSRAIANIGWVQ